MNKCLQRIGLGLAKKKLSTFLSLSLLASCVHNKITDEEHHLRNLELKAETVLSGSMQWALPNSLPKHLLIPGNLLALGHVVSSHVELRTGPGTAYPINDQLLPYDSLVIEIDKSGVWRKIAVLASGVTGWVHHKQIKRKKYRNRSIVKVPIRSFPVVRTLKKIHQIISYESHQGISVKIPENTPLLRLNTGKKGVLVWLSHTNSVAWISKSASF